MRTRHLLHYGGLLLLGWAVSGCPKSGGSNGSLSPNTRPGGQAFVWSDDKTAIQLALGNPTNAKHNAADRTNYLMQRPQYSLAYNDDNHTANWVSWHVEAADLGSVERGKFQPDPDLPSGYYPVTPRDYTGSKYDRGHLCPSADRTDTPENNDMVFYMTNIVPQAPGNNQGPWKLLEDYGRDLVRNGSEIYVIAGGAGRKGGNKGTIGKKVKIVVPETMWKVMVVLPEKSGNDLARITANTRVIAVMMPNVSTVRQDKWQQYRVTVADIEKATGYTLLSNLPGDVQQTLKQKKDNE